MPKRKPAPAESMESLQLRLQYLQNQKDSLNEAYQPGETYLTDDEDRLNMWNPEIRQLQTKIRQRQKLIDRNDLAASFEQKEKEIKENERELQMAKDLVTIFVQRKGDISSLLGEEEKRIFVQMVKKKTEK